MGSAWNEGQLDISGSLMIITLKLVSFGVNYNNGLKDSKNLTPYQKDFQIRNLPNPLEFMSYIFQNGNLLSGPFNEYMDHANYMTESGLWASKSYQTSSSFAVGVKKLIQSIFLMGIYVAFSAKYSSDKLLTPEYRSSNAFIRFFTLMVVGAAARLKYYFVWTISDTGMTFSGYNYNGVINEKVNWDRHKNINIRKVESATSLGDAVNNWNLGTCQFLKHYVYENMKPVGKKAPSYAIVVTELVSAVWHGVRAAYLISFISLAFSIKLSKKIYKIDQSTGFSKLPRSSPVYIIGTALKWFFSIYLMNNAALPFMLLEVGPTMAVYKSLFYSGIIINLLALVP